ncbi:MAG TPA: hypothetical protein VGK99_18195 [Acidobacteriota bacterium]|jgi:hypothetical protein
MKPESHLTQDQWIEFQYGRFGEAERRELEGHLRACVECREFAAGLAAVRDLFQIDVPVPSGDLWARMQSQVMQDFRRHRASAGPEMVFRNLRDAAGRIWLFLTDDPLAAMAYTCAATGYLLYSVFSISQLQGLVPGPDQVLSLIRFAF